MQHCIVQLMPAHSLSLFRTGPSSSLVQVAVCEGAVPWFLIFECFTCRVIHSACVLSVPDTCYFSCIKQHVHCVSIFSTSTRMSFALISEVAAKNIFSLFQYLCSTLILALYNAFLQKGTQHAFCNLV